MHPARTVSCRHPCFPPSEITLARYPRSVRSGLCPFRGCIGNGKRSRAIEGTELTLALRQAVGHRPQRGRIDPDADMAGEMDLDIFGRLAGTQQAGPPVHDTVTLRVDRRDGHLKI